MGDAPPDLVIDDSEASFIGTWPSSTSSPDYWDEDYKTLYQACRREDKSFAFRRRRSDVKNPNLNDPDDWIWNLDGVELVPYRLPQLLEWDAVFIVEGAGNWDDTCNNYFKGKCACIIPDNDKKGLKHAQNVANSLYNVADEVLILELPCLKQKGDAFSTPIWLMNAR